MAQIAAKSDEFPYTTRLLKGGALLDDMRVLVRLWGEQLIDNRNTQVARENLLGKNSRNRSGDVYNRVFVPRFLRGHPPEAWRVVRPLEDRNLPVDVLRPLYYWITARNEPLIYDYATEELMQRLSSENSIVRIDEAVSWIKKKLSTYQKSWSQLATLKIARGMLAALRDFGVLEGEVTKRIAPVYLPIEAFAYLAFVLHLDGVSGERLVHHKDWQLFLLSPKAVEELFLEAHQRHLLLYQAAGKIVRIEFIAGTLEEMADVITQRSR